MRIESGVTTRYIYFVAVDATDFSTRETGLTPASFTVYRSRNGGAAALMTTPTINETDTTNMPGVYELLLDEDMTIGSGNDSEEMCFHITYTGMAPVTRTIELYRPKITAGNTLTVESDGDLTQVNTLAGHTAQTGDNYARLGAPAGASVSADISTIDTNVSGVKTKTDSLTFTVANQVDANAIAISGDTAAADNLESTYDGTGYTNDEAPAKQSQLSSLDSIIDAIKTVTDAIPNGGALNNLSAAQINTEVSDVIKTDNIAELSGVPSATPTLQDAIMLLYMALRNRVDVDTTGTDAMKLHNDAGTQIGSKVITDDGTDYSEAKMT